MDSGVVHSHVQEYDEHHPHNIGSQQVEVAHHEGEEHHHEHEKKSVLKKVKAKAKKIKDTVKKHGHHDHDDHDHEYHNKDQHIPDDHDLDEEDDEDEEMVEDPEVHGAPIYESAAVRSVIPGEEPPHHEGPRVVVVSPNTESDQNRANDSATTFGEEEGYVGQRKVSLERPTGLVEDPDAPRTSTPQPHTASNYQTKVTDPTGAGVFSLPGAAEIDIAPVQKSFARMNVHQEPEPKGLPNLPSETTSLYPRAGSHDQNFPDLPATTQYPSASAGRREEQRPYEPMEKPSNQSSYTDTITPSNQSSYTDTVTPVTSEITDKATAGENAVASKLGYGNDKATTTYKDHNTEDAAAYANASTTSGATPTEYGKKIATSLTEKLAPVYGKVAGVGSAVKCKVSSATNGTESGVSMKDYLAEKLRPGDEDRALSEVISEALHKREEGETEKTEHGGLGKVTESEKVKKRLGSEEEKSEKEGYEEKGVVDKLKDVVGSWFGKAEENQSCQAAEGEVLSKNSDGEAGLVERRLYESSN